jgi:hypothetical protein
MIDTNTHEYRLLEEMLAPDEKVIMEVVERRIGGAPFFGVAHTYITNDRILIIRRYFMNVHHSIKVIKYSEISDLQIECGLVFCKIHFAIKGEPTTENDEGGHKWLRGLWYKEAIRLINHVNKVDVKKPISLDVVGSKEGDTEE